MVLVSFRPSILNLADRVYDFRDGKLYPAEGTPASLPSKAVALSRQLTQGASRPPAENVDRAIPKSSGSAAP